MFDETFGSNSDKALQAIREGRMSPVMPNPTIAPNGWWANLMSGGQQGSLIEQLGSLGGGGGSGLLGLGQFGLGAIGSIGGLMNSRNMLGLARDQFRHTRDVTNTNLNNQIQAYNTALSDRARTRAVMEGRDTESANRYIEENRLRR